MKPNISFEQALMFTNLSFKRITSQTRVDALFAEIRRFANYMIKLEARSPIRAVWEYDAETVQSMDVSKYPRLQAMQKQVVSEMLSAADAGDYYRANPQGIPFRRRIDAATPLLDAFMTNAMRMSRKNAQKAIMKRKRIMR